MSNTDHKTENSNTTYIILSIPNSIPIRLQTGAVISRSLAFVKKSFNGMLFRPPKVRDSKEGDNKLHAALPPPLSWADCGK